METMKTKGFTAKDEFNAASATPIKEAKGQELTVSEVMVTEKVDEDGVLTKVGYIKTTDGEIYATISATIIDQLIPLVVMIDEDGDQTVSVITKTSNAGREYFMLALQ